LADNCCVCKRFRKRESHKKQ